MTYVDTMLTPEAGYTYINARQIYDVVAGGMTTHPAWDYVEYVEAVSAPNTYRRYVWKCNAAQSGLSTDFYVVFQVPYTTATGSTLGWHTTTAVRVWMGETYSTQTLGKFATNQNSVTLASDLSNPATFPLATYTWPTSLADATASNCSNYFGTTSNVTSLRFWCLVTKDVLIITRGGAVSQGTTGTPYLLYVGAYERVLSAAVDPVPLVMMGSYYATPPYAMGGCTRAPTFTPSTAYTEVFCVGGGPSAGSATAIGDSGSWATNTNWLAGALGSAATTSWLKSVGGPLVSRLGVMPALATASTTSTKGLFRGYLQYVYGANYAAHSYGDTFVVNGRVHVGTGNGSQGPVVDTEAV